MKTMLMRGETVVADRGYRGDLRIQNPDMGTKDQKKSMTRAHARHETANGRLKNRTALSQRFRHGRDRHHI
eukprot:4946031-Ditylum_brightwellii.AAC.1